MISLYVSIGVVACLVLAFIVVMFFAGVKRVNGGDDVE